MAKPGRELNSALAYQLAKGSNATMHKPHIVVVDDDPAILRLLSANLKGREYDVTTVMDGEEALKVVERELVDLIILDIMMPRLDGMEVCARIREWSQVPIIMLSAQVEESDKVKCLELGADDYLTKPFGIAELMARVKTALRHSVVSNAAPVQPVFHCGDIEINFTSRRVTVRGTEIKLTPTEYSLLQQLAVNAGQALTHHMLLQKVWGKQYHGEREYLRVFIRRLRIKLEANPEKPRYIVTIPGVGYRFAPVS